MNYSTGLISLALPCYNEAENIVSVMQASIQELEKIGRPWELIVIDNHSSDRTPAVVQEFMRTEFRVRLIVHPENRLYSGSCATAVREARGELVAIMDSDGQFSAVDLPQMIVKLAAGANLVIGWRKERHDPVSRKVMSAVFNALGKYWLGFPLHDLNCGIRMFDRRFADVCEIRHRINLVNPEMYVRAYNSGLKLDEVVITHAERTKGQTSHDFKKTYQIFRTVNAYFRTLKAEKTGPVRA
jgi:glycosyltransferase involved in cell wall biosynthesis